MIPPPGRPTWTGRPSRPRRSLPEPGDGTSRSLWCVELRAVEEAWLRRPLGEIRIVSRGGRLGALFGELDVDPRRTMRHNARSLPRERAQQLFDALCEELADTVLHDLPAGVWRALLPLVAPHGQGEHPYPAEGTLPGEDEVLGGLVILAEGRFEAEAASVACSHTPQPPVQQHYIDPLLWREVMSAVLGMLESVRDKNRALLIEA